MRINFENAQKKVFRIVQDYLFNLSSLKRHNHFFMANRIPDHPEARGFYMLTGRNQYIIDEEYFLEGCTRVFLINPIMKELLDMAGIENDWKYGNTFADFQISNRAYELNSFVEFIFKWNGENIGCRYTRHPYSSSEPVALMYRDRDYLFAHEQIPGFEGLTYVDKLWCIDWANDESTIEQQEIKLPPELTSLDRNMSVKQFFEELFSTEIYELVVSQTQYAVKRAEKIIALEAMPQLLPNNMLAFKYAVIEKFNEGEMEGKAYKFRNHVPARGESALSDEDMAAINEAFFKNGYRYSLIGDADFAQSFITSEFLFSTVKSGLSIDYTTVVVGYLKAVEQLLYTLYISAFRGAVGMVYWDSCKGKHQNKFDVRLPQYRYDPYNSDRMQEKYYHKKRTGSYTLEFGELAQFLRYYDECWNVSEAGKEYIYECLDDFRTYCRNHHFHKDNIGDKQYEDVKTISNNSIVCLYYLLGAFKFLDTSRSVPEQLGIIDYRFEDIYRTVWERHKPLFWASFDNEYDGIIFYNGIELTDDFDQSGRMPGAVMKFVKYPHMDMSNAFIDEIRLLLNDEEYIQTHTIEITHEHLPRKIVPIWPSRKARGYDLK